MKMQEKEGGRSQAGMGPRKGGGSLPRGEGKGMWGLTRESRLPSHPAVPQPQALSRSRQGSRAMFSSSPPTPVSPCI